MEEILKITLNEDNGEISVDCPDREKAIITSTNHIHHSMIRGDQKALNFLFAVSVHLLAMEPSGKFEQNYCENLHRAAKEYRNVFLQTLYENRS